MKASDHGNSDAKDRLAALSEPSSRPLSRQEHDTITENKLINKHTQAKQRSEVTKGVNPQSRLQTHINGRQIIDVVRKNLGDYAPGLVQNALGFEVAQLSPDDPGGCAYPRYPLTNGKPGKESPPSIDRPVDRPHAAGIHSGKIQPALRSRPVRSPTTFAEMGIPVARAEDKECVMM